MMKINVYRDCDTLRVRKIVIEIIADGLHLIDRARMFAGPFFAQRLARRIARMKKRAAIMMAASV